MVNHQNDNPVGKNPYRGWNFYAMVKWILKGS